MATRIGVGVISKSNNAEIELLNLVRAENETLMVEKLDLEKIPKELKEKVDNLENQVKELNEQITILTDEKSDLENQVKELNADKDNKKTKKDADKAEE